MSQRNGHFLISFLCLTIALHLPLLTYAEWGREYSRLLDLFFSFLITIIYSIGIIIFSWIKQKETLKWWTVFIFPFAFLIYGNFITQIISKKGVRAQRKSLEDTLEGLLSFTGLFFLIIIIGMCITLWLMIRYFREAAQLIRK